MSDSSVFPWTAPTVVVHYESGKAPAFAAVVVLQGEHDLDTCAALEEALEPIFGNVLLDLSDCRFIDSSVIGVIVSEALALHREGHRLELIVPPANRQVTRVVDLLGLRELLVVHDGEPPAQPPASVAGLVPVVTVTRRGPD